MNQPTLMFLPEDVRHAVTLLRDRFPAICPVRVVMRDRQQMKDHTGRPCIGYAEFHQGRGQHFEISLCRSMSKQARFETLLHEWAHVLAWPCEDQDSAKHTAEWGVAYAKIWSWWFDDEAEQAAA